MTIRIYINGRYLTQGITGVQRYGHELVRAIDAAQEAGEFEFTLLAPARGLKFEPRLDNIELRLVGRHDGHIWEQHELPRYSADGLLFCPGNLAPLTTLLKRRPIVVTIHDLSYKYFPDAYSGAFRALYGFLMPFIVHRSRRIITVSNSEATAISRHYPCAVPRLAAIQNGGFGAEVLQHIDSIAGRQLGFKYGVYVGSLSKRKNFPVLLDAAIRFARTTGMGFVFVGGVPPGLRPSAMEIPSDLKERIILAGSTNDAADLVSWYKGASFMAFPSLYEASPFPPIEAMSCGCPVIASRIPSLLERCGDAAEYCDPSKSDEIVGAMVRLATDDPLRSSKIELGYKRAAEYRWDFCARQTIEVLREAASGGNRP